MYNYNRRRVRYEPPKPIVIELVEVRRIPAEFVESNEGFGWVGSNEVIYRWVCPSKVEENDEYFKPVYHEFSSEGYEPDAEEHQLVALVYEIRKRCAYSEEGRNPMLILKDNFRKQTKNPKREILLEDLVAELEREIKKWNDHFSSF